MPRFFFHVHDGHSIPDEEGVELLDLAAAKREAVKLAGGVLVDHPGEFWAGDPWVVEVQDETGKTLFNLHFSASDG